MKNKHRFSEPIIKSMKTLLKGEVHFTERQNNWSINVAVKWNKKWMTITIKARKLDLNSNFVSCVLTNAPFLSFLTRSDSYNFSGEKSYYSELLLEIPETPYLMDSKNASIKLNEKCLIFSGGIRKKDTVSLSNIFKLFDVLLIEIDALGNSN